MLLIIYKGKFYTGEGINESPRRKQRGILKKFYFIRLKRRGI